jgi:gamma-glutamylcyclotransferase (GGCT)/AIG2-like uncharacterized protein YtfP
MVNFLIYGTLREGEPLNWLLPTSRGSYELIALQGYVMYDLGLIPGVRRAKNTEGHIVAEFWRFDLSRMGRWWLFMKLAIAEGTLWLKYRKVRVKTEKGEAYMYLYLRRVKNSPMIWDWKKR